MSVFEVSSVLSGFAAIIAAGAAVFTIRQAVSSSLEQLRLLIFTDYTKRYQEICLHLPSDIGSQEFDYDALHAEAREEFHRYMRAYFDLCSEEYFLSLSGKIDEQVWKEWKSGIIACFNKPAFRMAWNSMRTQRADHIEFTRFIESVAQREYC